MTGPDDDDGLGEAAGPDFVAPTVGLDDHRAPEPTSEPAPETSSEPASGHRPAATPSATQESHVPADRTDAVPGGVSDAVPDAGPARRGPTRTSLRQLKLVVGVITAAVLVVSVGVSMAPTWRLLNGGSGSRGPTSAPFTPMPAQPMSADHFTFTSPDGWARASDWATSNDAALVDRSGNTIRVYSWTDDDAADRCERELTSLQIWVPGEISSVPGRKVGGRPAPGGTLQGEEVYVLRCVAYRGLVFNMSSKADPDDVDDVATAYAAVLDSWKWT